MAAEGAVGRVRGMGQGAENNIYDCYDSRLTIVVILNYDVFINQKYFPVTDGSKVGHHRGAGKSCCSRPSGQGSAAEVKLDFFILDGFFVVRKHT